MWRRLGGGGARAGRGEATLRTFVSVFGTRHGGLQAAGGKSAEEPREAPVSLKRTVINEALKEQRREQGSARGSFTTAQVTPRTTPALSSRWSVLLFRHPTSTPDALRLRDALPSPSAHVVVCYDLKTAGPRAREGICCRPRKEATSRAREVARSADLDLNPSCVFLKCVVF